MSEEQVETVKQHIRRRERRLIEITNNWPKKARIASSLSVLEKAGKYGQG
jgi:hypothetical protein